jgi:hypothetical protein
MQAQAHVGLALARGKWSYDANKPLIVSDPLKARHLLGMDGRRPTAKAISRHEAGIMPYSVFLRAIPRLDFPKLRALEALLSGAEVFAHDDWHNLVTNEGLNYALDAALSGGSPDTTWFVLLTDDTPTVAAGDTLASHAGWVEVTDYDESNRVAWVDGGVSSQSVSNSGSPAVFTIDTNSTTIGGAGLAGVNTGTSGALYAVGAFTAGSKVLDDNDTLSVTITATLAAA